MTTAQLAVDAVPIPSDVVPAAVAAVAPDAAMPPMDPGGPPISPYEFWSMGTFYAPVVLYVL